MFKDDIEISATVITERFDKLKVSKVSGSGLDLEVNEISPTGNKVVKLTLKLTDLNKVIGVLEEARHYIELNE